MGCCFYCCKKSKELKELEDELDMLVNQKRLLEMKVYSQSEKQETESASSSTFTSTESVKFMDYDLYTSLKLIETTFPLITGESDAYHELSQKVQKIVNLKGHEKILKYGEARCEATEIQKKVLILFQEHFKELAEILRSKYNIIEERIEKIESLLLNSESLLEERQTVIKKFKNIQNGKKDFGKTLENLKGLEDIDRILNEIEKQLPGLNKDLYFELKLKEVENAFFGLNKTSCLTFSSLETVLGRGQGVEVGLIKNAEIPQDTYSALFGSLAKYLSTLQDLETKKLEISCGQKIAEKLVSIDETLKTYFFQSEKNKELAFARLKRLSSSSSDFSFMSQFTSSDFDPASKSLLLNIEILDEKVQNYIKSVSTQDQLLVQMTEKLNSIESIIDEIELKFQEFLSAEVKDLYKLIVYSDQPMKHLLDKTNEQLIQYTEIAHRDLAERLEYFQNKVSLTEDLEKIKSSIRDSQSKELTRAKNEYLEKLSDLNNRLSLSENEKKLISDTLNTHRSQLLATTELSESLLKVTNEKDLFVTSLKNNIASLQENLQQTEEDKSKLQDEVDDLQKELRECKKQLRNKDHELAELKESFEKVDN